MVGKGNSILDVIGNTPTIRLSKIPAKEKIAADIFAKLEAFNPTESLKDRIYKEMILGAIERGDLRPGMEILEASTGNAGIACTFIGTRLGYRVTIVMPEGMSDERKKMIRAFGGELVLTPGAESDVDLCLERIDELMKKNRGKYWVPAQFSNPDNPLAHYKGTGPELWNQLEGRVDAFIASQGTGGVLTGVGRYLKEKNRKVKLFAVEPSEAPILSHSKWGTHKIEGIGDGFVPKNLDLSQLDGVVTTTSEESIEMTKRLGLEEGIFCGISSGCNVAAAIKLSRNHPELRRIATIINDSGGRYLSTEVFGIKKAKTVPRTTKPLDPYSKEQLARYQKGFEIVE
ncbi:MAG TPA: cysteine synthase family protein [Nitrososphaerales archaeon]|nr:cysteine synthase family protein [Nitrososphaerales archaeon]